MKSLYASKPSVLLKTLVGDPLSNPSKRAALNPIGVNGQKTSRPCARRAANARRPEKASDPSPLRSIGREENARNNAKAGLNQSNFNGLSSQTPRYSSSNPSLPSYRQSYSLNSARPNATPAPVQQAAPALNPYKDENGNDKENLADLEIRSQKQQLFYNNIEDTNVDSLLSLVASLEQQLEDSLQSHKVKDIIIEQLQEMVKLKELQVKELEIERMIDQTRGEGSVEQRSDADRQTQKLAMLIESNSKYSAATPQGRADLGSRSAANPMGTPSKSSVGMQRDMLTSQGEIMMKAPEIVQTSPDTKSPARNMETQYFYPEECPQTELKSEHSQGSNRVGYFDNERETYTQANNLNTNLDQLHEQLIQLNNTNGSTTPQPERGERIQSYEPPTLTPQEENLNEIRVLQFDDKLHTLEGKCQTIDTDSPSNLRMNQTICQKDRLKADQSSYGNFAMPQQTFVISPNANSPETSNSSRYFAGNGTQGGTTGKTSALDIAYQTQPSEIGRNGQMGLSRNSSKSVVQPSTSARTDKSPNYRPAWSRYASSNNGQSHKLLEKRQMLKNVATVKNLNLSTQKDSKSLDAVSQRSTRTQQPIGNSKMKEQDKSKTESQPLGSTRQGPQVNVQRVQSGKYFGQGAKQYGAGTNHEIASTRSNEKKFVGGLQKPMIIQQDNRGKVAAFEKIKVLSQKRANIPSKEKEQRVVNKTPITQPRCHKKNWRSAKRKSNDKSLAKIEKLCSGALSSRSKVPSFVEPQAAQVNEPQPGPPSSMASQNGLVSARTRNTAFSSRHAAVDEVSLGGQRKSVPSSQSISQSNSQCNFKSKSKDELRSDLETLCNQMLQTTDCSTSHPDLADISQTPTTIRNRTQHLGASRAPADDASHSQERDGTMLTSLADQAEQSALPRDGSKQTSVAGEEAQVLINELPRGVQMDFNILSSFEVTLETQDLNLQQLEVSKQNSQHTQASRNTNMRGVNNTMQNSQEDDNNMVIEEHQEEAAEQQQEATGIQILAPEGTNPDKSEEQSPYQLQTKFADNNYYNEKTTQHALGQYQEFEIIYEQNSIEENSQSRSLFSNVASPLKGVKSGKSPQGKLLSNEQKVEALAHQQELVCSRYADQRPEADTQSGFKAKQFQIDLVANEMELASSAESRKHIQKPDDGSIYIESRYQEAGVAAPGYHSQSQKNGDPSSAVAKAGRCETTLLEKRLPAVPVGGSTSKSSQREGAQGLVASAMLFESQLPSNINSHEKQINQEIFTTRKEYYLDTMRMKSGENSQDSSQVKISVIDCHNQQRRSSGGSGETQEHMSNSDAENYKVHGAHYAQNIVSSEFTIPDTQQKTTPRQDPDLNYFQMHNDSLFHVTQTFKTFDTPKLVQNTIIDKQRSDSSARTGHHDNNSQLSILSVYNLPKPRSSVIANSINFNCVSKGVVQISNKHSRQISQANQSNPLTRVPGEAYQLVGEFLDERLPLIIFTNRLSYKICLQFQIAEYEQLRLQAHRQMTYIQKTVAYAKEDQSGYTEDELRQIEELEGEVQSIQKIVEAYNCIKNNIIDFKNIVA